VDGVGGWGLELVDGVGGWGLLLCGSQGIYQGKHLLSKICNYCLLEEEGMISL
jgi:hypothetical protein